MHVLEKVELNSMLIHNARELVPQFDTLVQAVGANHVFILVERTQQNICITAMMMKTESEASWQIKEQNKRWHARLMPNHNSSKPFSDQLILCVCVCMHMYVCVQMNAAQRKLWFIHNTLHRHLMPAECFNCMPFTDTPCCPNTDLLWTKPVLSLTLSASVDSSRTFLHTIPMSQNVTLPLSKDQQFYNRFAPFPIFCCLLL